MNTDTPSRPRVLRRLTALAAGAALVAAAALPGRAAHAAPSDLAAAFANLGAGRLATRSVALADLGVHETVTLHAPDTREEWYLPVPAGLPLTDAQFQLDGNYLRADGGRTTLLLSLDGTPVLARALTADAGGDVSASVGVDDTARAGGFVRVGLAWSSVLDRDVCTDQTAIGNVLRVAPDSHLTYRFDPAAIGDLRTAWSALPPAPVVMTGARAVAAPAFDTGWRLEAQLQREGRTSVTRAWPAAGDTVDLSGVQVPPALRAIPAFAALAAGSKAYRLASPAEAGALVALAPPNAFAPDLIVADDTLRQTLKTELDALRAQVAGVSGDAASAFDAWRARATGPIADPLAAGEVRLAHLAGQTAIVVGDAPGVTVLSQAWRALAVAQRLTVHDIDGAPDAGADAVSLAALGGVPRTLDVLGLAEWDMHFDLAQIAKDGKLPQAVQLEVSSAPTGKGGEATASIYLNDVLIGAQLLDGTGKPQQIRARVPQYALAPENQLRVVFQRQPEAGCLARSPGHPIGILPGSRLLLGKGTLDDDFTGMVARYASGATLLVPDAWLADAPANLLRTARLADAAGLVPSRTTLSVVQAGTAASPSGPFLAADVALQDQTAHAVLSKDRLTLKTGDDKMLADVSGLHEIALIDVVHAGKVPGIAFNAGTPSAAVLPAGLQLSRGDVAVIDSTGVLKRFDTLHPGQVVDDVGRPAAGWFDGSLWRWGVPAVLVVLFLLLLLAARVARRRNQDRS